MTDGEGLINNYCRNPSRNNHGAWCYINANENMDDKMDWDFCDIKPFYDDAGKITKLKLFLQSLCRIWLNGSIKLLFDYELNQFG